MTTTSDTIDITTDPTVTDPADVDVIEPASDAAAPPAGELVQFPVEALAPHPDNPRKSLGDLDERSGFHLMRATASVLILASRLVFRGHASGSGAWSLGAA